MEKIIKTGHPVINRIMCSMFNLSEYSHYDKSVLAKDYGKGIYNLFYSHIDPDNTTMCEYLSSKSDPGLSWDEIKCGQKVKVIGGYLTKGSILVKVPPFPHPKPVYKYLMQEAIFVLNNCDDCISALGEYCRKTRFELIEDV